MASDTRTRASDADRDRTVAALREHTAVGRLTLEEFNERLDKACAAKTLGELDDLTADLPGADLERLPAAAPARAGGNAALPARRSPGPVAGGQGRFSPAWRAAWGSWLAVSLCVFAIWLISGASGGPWFLWVALPLGALMLGRWITGGPARGGRGSGRTSRAHRHHAA
jgi:Domain of unknown function (DUF1707)